MSPSKPKNKNKYEKRIKELIKLLLTSGITRISPIKETPPIEIT